MFNRLKIKTKAKPNYNEKIESERFISKLAEKLLEKKYDEEIIIYAVEKSKTDPILMDLINDYDFEETLNNHKEKQAGEYIVQWNIKYKKEFDKIHEARKKPTKKLVISFKKLHEYLIIIISARIAEINNLDLTIEDIAKIKNYKIIFNKLTTR